jgi:hypothetical protein
VFIGSMVHTLPWRTSCGAALPLPRCGWRSIVYVQGCVTARGLMMVFSTSRVQPAAWKRHNTGHFLVVSFDLLVAWYTIPE